MGFELTLFQAGFSSDLVKKQAVNEVMKQNELTAQYGLALTESQAVALVETRAVELKKTGRIEFGGGIIDKIILTFCDSPYLHKNNYEETLHELVEIFYHYKNETLDITGDDELLAYMKKAYDGVCQGSLELLAGRELEAFAREIRCGGVQAEVQSDVDLDEEDEDGGA